MKLRNITLPIGIILGIFFLYQITSEKIKSKNFEDLALGQKNTPIYLGKTDNRIVHCRDLNDLKICLDNYNKVKQNMPVTLWLGNSQIHAINRFSPGEETASPELHRLFFRLNHYFLTFSQANANLQEHYLFFAHLLNYFPIERLVLPVVFDDMREEGIREGFADAFNYPNTVKLLDKSEIGRDLIKANINKNTINNSLNGFQGTLQELVENKLNEKLESTSKLWVERSKLRGITYNYLYQIRNSFFGINPSSIRKIIPGNFKKNLKSLNAILKLASKYQVKVILYIPPLRSDVKIPYDINEYKSFKRDIVLTSQKYNVTLLNLEDLVPNELWGIKPTNYYTDDFELDFMHFQEGGHRLLAEALYNGLINLELDP